MSQILDNKKQFQKSIYTILILITVFTVIKIEIHHISPLFLSRAHQRLTPMVTGHQIRMNRILRNGKMLCIPMDHGISNGPLKGI